MKNWQNNIPENWKIEEFRNIAELRHGYQFRNYDFTEEGIKIFKITQIKGDGIADISSCSYINSNRIDEFERVVLNKGDILIALTGATIGKVARFNFDEIVLQNYRVGNFFPLDEKVLSKEFFFQFLKSDFFYNQILANQTQSAQQNIGKEDINNMSVVFPPLTEQIQIANILSAIDNKIENNLAINKTLEDMAMALYKHWFVDFGPFQDGTFIDSELGPIPKGWEVKSVYDLATYVNGAAFKTSDFSEDGLYVIKIAELKNGITGNTNKSLKKIKSELVLHNGAVLFSWSASLDVFLWDKGDAFLNQHIFNVLPNGALKIEIIYFLLRDIINHFQAIAASRATTMGHIKISHLKETMLPVPSKNSQEKINKEFEPIFNQILENKIENQTLTQLRDTLLPKLISGEVRLKEFRDQVENVL